MKQLTWPTAFALVFGGVPAFVFSVAVLIAFPWVGWPLIGVVLAGYGLHRRAQTRAELAAQSVRQHAANAALVAAPLPDMPTVPLRGVA